MNYKTSAEPRAYIDGIPVFCAYDKFVQIGQMIPNPKNPNTHPDSQVALLADIIRANGWRNNITVSRRSGMVVRGHGRLLAALALGLSSVPVEYQTYASEAEELADLAADNRLAELSVIDDAALGGLLDLIVEDVPLELAGYPAQCVAVESEPEPQPTPEATEDEAFSEFVAQKAAEMDSDNPEYSEFVDKFKPKPKLTTDDCFTPVVVYAAIRDWACEEFGIKPESIVRPFFPGGDFESFEYPDGCVVVDNPPFSILAKIVGFYVERNIGFFLFAPALTAMGILRNRDNVSVVFADGRITYENGAVVNTAFVTNLCPQVSVMICQSLALRLKNAAEKYNSERMVPMPKYSYPPNVLTGAMCGSLSRHASFCVPRKQALFVSALDSQRESGSAIFGGGLLLSEKAAAEKAAATVWELSEREKQLIREMDDAGG